MKAGTQRRQKGRTFGSQAISERPRALRTGLAAGVPYRYFSCVEVLTTVTDPQPRYSRSITLTLAYSVLREISDGGVVCIALL